MIITKEEYINIYNNAKYSFMTNAKNIVLLGEAGFVNNPAISALCIQLNSLEALKTYDTGNFVPAEYFNSISANDVADIYYNINK